MQSYCYHLKIELYATPDPTTTTTTSGTCDAGARDIWIPQKGADIFADLPEHPREKKSEEAE